MKKKKGMEDWVQFNLKEAGGSLAWKQAQSRNKTSFSTAVHVFLNI